MTLGYDPLLRFSRNHSIVGPARVPCGTGSHNVRKAPLRSAISGEPSVCLKKVPGKRAAQIRRRRSLARNATQASAGTECESAPRRPAACPICPQLAQSCEQRSVLNMTGSAGGPRGCENAKNRPFLPRRNRRPRPMDTNTKPPISQRNWQLAQFVKCAHGETARLLGLPGSQNRALRFSLPTGARSD